MEIEITDEFQTKSALPNFSRSENSSDFFQNNKTKQLVRGRLHGLPAIGDYFGLARENFLRDSLL